MKEIFGYALVVLSTLVALRSFKGGIKAWQKK
jgi:hypothetical protein